ncbi:hypothetical protein [Pseudomaricurvus sp. HS19]|uniref:hypothetical protein n=1 Tax=Pseudomaricurvus sp. HS19 TaxID=2692626 RepID=UPI00192818C8|nr:hypothetical protein [Pseudomaricurvus sp. HS19]
MSAIEQVRLLRLGVEAIAEAAKQNAPSRVPVSRVQKSYKRPADSAPRATLSLKRKSSAEES